MLIKISVYFNNQVFIYILAFRLLKANEWDRGQEFQIQVQDERIQALEDELKRIKDENMERINTLENELKKTKDESAEQVKSLENELKLSKDGNVSETEKEIMKSHDDRVQSLEKELTDLNYVSFISNV